MVKTYLKYEQSSTFGVVASSSANIVWSAEDAAQDPFQRRTGAGRAFVGANEEVLCWDIKKGDLLSRWRDKDSSALVTAIARSQADTDIFAIGYADGSIRLWDSTNATVLINFNGHRSAVTTLSFDTQGIRLASGARDTDIIVWDLVAETGLFKLRGHKDQITGLNFLQIPALDVSGIEGESRPPLNGNVNGAAGSTFLLSTSKDALIKLWDVESQYCVETHVTQSNGECWGLGMSPDESGCITAGNDGEIKIWSLDTESLQNLASRIEGSHENNILHERGVLNRQGRDRTTGVSFHPKANYIAVHGNEKAVELWRIRTPSEIQKSLARKKRRRKEKAVATSNSNEETNDQHKLDGQDSDEDSSFADITEVFVPYMIVRTGGKVRSIHWAGGNSNKSLQLLISTTNNQLEFYDAAAQQSTQKPKNQEGPEYSRIHAVDLPGHRTDIRGLSISSDDKMLASASNGSLKVWNVQTQNCLRTLECGYALCCAFLPGDRIVLVGNKSGDLELFDIASSSLIETIQAHEGSIWTLRVHPDGKSVVSGGADKTVKFWNFEVIQEDIPGTRRTTSRLKLKQTRTLKVNDDVLNVCFSPDSRLLAVATLDNTVKVYFCDTLKLFLNLYGHKLPVLNMSISSDSKLIATCSADKNVRLWGLDFGDCHKAFFAHDESIMQVAFIPQPTSKEDTHMFFSASKDHLLKTWDGDKFEQVQKLSGHHGEVWAMAVSRIGDFVVTASHDKSIRIWSQTDEPLFLEEERERELEEMYDSNLANSLEKDQADEYAAAEGEGAEVVPASKQTSTTLTASEKIIEALNICTEDLEMMRDYEKQKATSSSAAHSMPQRHPMLALRDQTAEAYLLSVFEAIPSSALHDALLLLSFSLLPSLFIFLSIWLTKEMNIPLTCRILFFLLKTHHRQIVTSREHRIQLQEMKVHLRQCLSKWKDVLGFNMAATKILSERIGEVKVRTIEDEDTVDRERLTGKKRAFVNVA